jgi:hypothetical protein
VPPLWAFVAGIQREKLQSKGKSCDFWDDCSQKILDQQYPQQAWLIADDNCHHRPHIKTKITPFDSALKGA